MTPGGASAARKKEVSPMMDAPEADRLPPVKKDRHKTGSLRVWMDATRLQKLDEMAAITGSTRSGVVRDLIDGIRRPSLAGVKAAGELSRIGGLMKQYRAGTLDQVEEILRIARELREGLIRGDLDH